MSIVLVHVYLGRIMIMNPTHKLFVKFKVISGIIFWKNIKIIRNTSVICKND